MKRNEMASDTMDEMALDTITVLTSNCDKIQKQRDEAIKAMATLTKQRNDVIEAKASLTMQHNDVVKAKATLTMQHVEAIEAKEY